MKLRELQTWKQHASKVISVGNVSVPMINSRRTRQLYSTLLVHYWSRSCTCLLHLSLTTGRESRMICRSANKQWSVQLIANGAYFVMPNYRLTP